MRQFCILLSEDAVDQFRGRKEHLLAVMGEAFPECQFEVSVGRAIDDDCHIDDILVLPVAGTVGEGWVKATDLPKNDPDELANMLAAVWAFAGGASGLLN